jgi:hypothetical protein
MGRPSGNSVMRAIRALAMPPPTSAASPIRWRAQFDVSDGRRAAERASGLARSGCCSALCLMIAAESLGSAYDLGRFCQSPRELCEPEKAVLPDDAPANSQQPLEGRPTLTVAASTTPAPAWSSVVSPEIYRRRWRSGFHDTSGPGTPLALADTRREWVPGPSR